MSRHDDDYYDMSSIDDIGATAGRPDPAPTGETAAVNQFLTDLRSLGEGRAPAPTAELETLLGGAIPISRARRRTRRALVRVGVAAAAVAAAMTVAAASHSLPQPAQRMVSNVVNQLTPFHIDPVVPAATPVPPAHPSPATPQQTGGDDGVGGDDGGSGGEDRSGNDDSVPGGNDGAAGNAGDATTGTGESGAVGGDD